MCVTCLARYITIQSTEYHIALPLKLLRSALGDYQLP